jgi:Protein of unknown function (DUF2782)
MSLLLTLLLAAAGAQAQPPAKATKDVPIPEKLPPPRNDKDAPAVSIRTGDNGDVIEEYRTNGKVTMVHIVPKNGVPYYLYDDNGDGRLDRTDADKNATVSPVYYTIYEWN